MIPNLIERLEAVQCIVSLACTAEEAQCAYEELEAILDDGLSPLFKKLTHPTIDINFYEWLGKIWDDIRPGLEPKDYLMQGFQAGRATLKEEE